jgi:hypothetical protein
MRRTRNPLANNEHQLTTTNKHSPATKETWKQTDKQRNNPLARHNKHNNTSNDELFAFMFFIVAVLQHFDVVRLFANSCRTHKATNEEAPVSNVNA